jgi:hypothetical protein
MVIYTFLPNAARLVRNVNLNVELILITIFEKTKRETKKMGPLRFKIKTRKFTAEVESKFQFRSEGRASRIRQKVF